MIPKVYVTNHVNSRVVSKAFAQGCDGKLVPPVKLLDGPAACYGILRGCGEIIRECQRIGRDFYHIDHGYFGRGQEFEGYYRVTQNAFQWEGIAEKPPFRFERLKIRMSPWRKNGGHIVVIPLTGNIARFLGIDGDEWLSSVINEIKQNTARRVLVKRKKYGSLTSVLRDAHCLVTHSSNAAVDAVISGVPVVCLGPSACKPVSTQMKDIETPNYPDRLSWAFDLAYRQFTLDEMRSGEAWELLNE